MKSILHLFFAVICINGFASDVRLIVQKLDNHNLVTGTTYRLYAEMPTENHSLHIVYGDLTNPLIIESTAPFYQHPFCGQSAIHISQALLEAAPAARFDSWITLGYEDGTGNSMWDVGVDYTDFNSGGSILANNGGWFLLPTDARCSPSNGRLVLIGQFTTTGIASGTMNLQGWTAPQQPWQAPALSFTTENAYIFGCMDGNAANYNPNATYDDGSCSTKDTDPGVAMSDHTIQPGGDWQIFPNPLRDDLLNIQLGDYTTIATNSIRIDIVDGKGKLIASHPVLGNTFDAKNRFTIRQKLSAGTYQILLVNGGNTSTKTLVVTK